ncbi:MAG: site-specific DNA-methyltransferase [Paludibacteraceae bacterium]|nr:site-specific DNA-methyltransferase [Paludibacteraceae bacterium]
MKAIPDCSVNLILTDPPYKVTAQKWDVEVNLDGLWIEWCRIIRNDGAIVVFGQEPFSSKVRCSNLQMYRYDLIWKKPKPSNFQLMNYQPGRVTENIMVFSKSKACFTSKGNNMKYNPQVVERDKPRKSNVKIYGDARLLHDYATDDNIKTYDVRQPTNILEFATVTRGKTHPTEKPVDLLGWLVRTYSDDGDIVLDCFMGTGSTGEACIANGRRFIGIEKDLGFFNTAKLRLLV